MRFSTEPSSAHVNLVCSGIAAFGGSGTTKVFSTQKGLGTTKRPPASGAADGRRGTRVLLNSKYAARPIHYI
jgi:hypothetical protein